MANARPNAHARGIGEYGIYLATNRCHEGDDRWHPVRYGKVFSSDGMENLRFG